MYAAVQDQGNCLFRRLYNLFSERSFATTFTPMADRLARILEMLSNSPNDEFLLFALAQEHKNAGRTNESILAFKNLRTKHPDYVGLYYHYAAVLAVSSHDQAAEEVYKAGIEVAQKVGDQHALAELKNAFLNWQIDQE